jgi:hypothetical protein
LAPIAAGVEYAGHRCDRGPGGRGLGQERNIGAAHNGAIHRQRQLIRCAGLEILLTRKPNQLCEFGGVYDGLIQTGCGFV